MLKVGKGVGIDDPTNYFYERFKNRKIRFWLWSWNSFLSIIVVSLCLWVTESVIGWVVCLNELWLAYWPSTTIFLSKTSNFLFTFWWKHILSVFIIDLCKLFIFSDLWFLSEINSGLLSFLCVGRAIFIVISHIDLI